MTGGANKLLGIDLGTTNLKSVLVDPGGRTLAVHREPVSYDTDATGRCELPAQRFVAMLGRSVRLVCKAADVRVDEIAGLSYASQANTFLLLEPDGVAATPILSWQDARVRVPDAKITSLWSTDRFLERTGLGIFSPQLAVMKLAELRKVGVPVEKLRFATISDYLIHLLTGAFTGDASTASMLGLYDLGTGSWWPDAIETIGMRTERMSHPVFPGAIAGVVSEGASRAFGLKRGIPVVAGGLDHYLAAVGSGARTVADACESTGTVVACVFTSDGIEARPGACFGPAVDGRYLLVFDSRGGTVLERYRASRCPETSFRRLDELAELAGPGAGGVTAVIGEDDVLSFTGSGAGADAGADESIGREARAVLEATAFRLDRLVSGAVTTAPERIVSTGGGARSDVWTRIKASVLGCTFVTVEPEEPAAYGAAYFAGRAAGLVEDCGGGIPESWVAVRSTVGPDPVLREYYLSQRHRYEVS